jgi:hypothetical protein
MKSGMSFETALERPRNANSVKTVNQESPIALSIRIGVK